MGENVRGKRRRNIERKIIGRGTRTQKTQGLKC